MNNPLRIVFAGTPDFAVPPLESLLASQHSLAAVYTQPDRPAGRGRKLAASPVKMVAALAGIPVLQPANLKDQSELDRLTDLKPDLMVVVAYGLILPEPLLAIPRLGCWNIHASLLPRWRGAAPIQRAILAGDTHTGVCIMQMDAGLDTGPVLARSELSIGDQESAASLHDRLAALGAAALMDCLADPDKLQARPQPEQGACYAHKLSKAEAQLDWTQPAVHLARAVRAFNPWPVAQAEVHGERLRIWQASAHPGGAGAPGTVVKAGAAGIDVATGSGVLTLIEVQRPGGKRISATDYLNARPELRHGQPR
jgi:methionyl-tRNA formyltransferase